MTEDNRPLYDIEGLWEMDMNIPGMVIKSHHKEYPHLYRLIDFEAQLYAFTDAKRVTAENIIDINKDIGIARKNLLSFKAMALISFIKPIVMPYKPEIIKVYVEDLGSYVGFLYFRSNLEPDTMVPIKRYFKVIQDPVFNLVEVSPDEFREFKERESE